MKRLALVAVAALAFAVLAAPALSENNHSSKSSTQPKATATCSLANFDVWAGKVWDQARWRRGDPPKSTIDAQRKWLECAANGHSRAAMQHFWREVKAAYYSARQVRLWRARVKPFVYPDGTHWAVPYPIALCESGENYNVGPSGAYGEIPPLPQWQTPKEQDETAHRLYEESGEGPWVPYESGCAYR